MRAIAIVLVVLTAGAVLFFSRRVRRAVDFDFYRDTDITGV